MALSLKFYKGSFLKTEAAFFNFLRRNLRLLSLWTNAQNEWERIVA